MIWERANKNRATSLFSFLEDRECKSSRRFEYLGYLVAAFVMLRSVGVKISDRIYKNGNFAALEYPRAALLRSSARRRTASRESCCVPCCSMSNVLHCCAVHRAELFDEDVWNEWVNQKAGLPLLASVGLFNRLKAVNVGVVFLTGRPENQRNATSANLISAGYKGWTALLLR